VSHSGSDNQLNIQSFAFDVCRWPGLIDGRATGSLVWGNFNMKYALVFAASAMALSGCATRASSVAPVSISASEYSTLSCSEAQAQRDAAYLKRAALERRQNNAALADVAAVALVALPLGSVFGADVEGELAQAKGEALALERATKIACDKEAAARTSAP
jgi:hypothetical protein